LNSNHSNHPLATLSHSVPAPFFPQAPDPYMHPGLSASQIWTILWAYRKLSFAIVVAILALTGAVLMLLPRTYEATAAVLVNYEVNDPLTSKEFPIGLLSSYLATQTELMSTPETLLKVVDQLNLTQDEDYRSGFRGGDGASLRDYVQKQLAKNLTIYQGQSGSHMIYITAAARTPEQAALIANTVTDIYKDREFARSTGPAVERAKRYADQLKQLSTKVSQAQQQFTEFHQRNGLIETGDGKADTEISLLSDLEKQLVDAERATRLAESAEGLTMGGMPLYRLHREIGARWRRSLIGTRLLERTEKSDAARRQEARDVVASLRQIVEDWGSPLQRSALTNAERVIESAIATGDQTVLQRQIGVVGEIGWEVLRDTGRLEPARFMSLEQQLKDNRDPRVQLLFQQGRTALDRGDGTRPAR